MKITWKIEPPSILSFRLAFSPSEASFFSAKYESMPTSTNITGTTKKSAIMFSLACVLKTARNKAPKDKIAPGSLGNCVPPKADAKIKMLKTISIFSMW